MVKVEFHKSVHERAVMLDSSPLISLYDKNYQEREEVKKILGKLADSFIPVFITPFIIAETHRRILYDIGMTEAQKFADSIWDSSLNLVSAETVDFEKAKEIIRKYDDQKITMCDAITMAIMLRIGILYIYTFDFHYSLLNFRNIQYYF